MKKEIVLFTSEFPPQPGGIGNHAYNLVKQLLDNHFSVHLLTDSRSRDNQVESDYDSISKVPITRVPICQPRILMYFYRLILLFSMVFKMRHGHPLLVASGKFPLWGMALLSCLFRKKQYIAIVHGSEVNFPPGLNHFLTRWALKRFNRIIGVSNYTLSLISDIVPKEQCVFIPNGFEANRLEKKSNIPLEGNPSLITVGGVTPRKGQHNVINALPEILKTYPKTHYHIVGIPTHRQEFEQLAVKLKVNQHVTFYGTVSDEELGQLLANSHIFLHA